jgi:lysophospholipase L1-like esterase
VPWHREYAAERGVPLLDVRHCCGPDADAMVFPFDKWHLNARGNDAVARAFAAELAESGVVSP